MFGRKSAYNLAISISVICSTGSALSKNFATLIAMQTIGGFEASWFMICGQAVLADIFRPVLLDSLKIMCEDKRTIFANGILIWLVYRRPVALRLGFLWLGQPLDEV